MLARAMGPPCLDHSRRQSWGDGLHRTRRQSRSACPAAQGAIEAPSALSDAPVALHASYSVPGSCSLSIEGHLTGKGVAWRIAERLEKVEPTCISSTHLQVPPPSPTGTLCVSSKSTRREMRLSTPPSTRSSRPGRTCCRDQVGLLEGRGYGCKPTQEAHSNASCSSGLRSHGRTQGVTQQITWQKEAVNRQSTTSHGPFGL